MSDEIDVVKITHKTYDLIAYDYSSKIDGLVADSWVGEFERELLDKFLLMTMLPHPSILEIGCGNGKDANYFRQKGAVPVAADISLSMLNEASKRVSGGVLCQMDMRSLGFADDSFDGVWANGCIYHVPKVELARVLKEVLRVLRLWGVFSFNFKVGSGERLDESPRSFKTGPRFFAYYKSREIKDYLRQAGFEVLEMSKYPAKIYDEELVHLWCRKAVAT